MDDLISRQAAIEAVGINTWAGFRIKNLPSADVVEKERYDRLLENSTIIADALSKYQSAQPEDYAELKREFLRMAKLHSIHTEPLTDAEQRIFLAAMGREEKICKNIDEELPGPYKDSLFKTCKEIERKVKKALWVNS